MQRVHPLRQGTLTAGARNVLNPSQVKSVRRTEAEIRHTVESAVQEQKVISFVSYMLSDYGENVLKIILSGILEKYNRLDLFDIAYSSTKELIINGTKANLKRMVFRKMNLDPDDEDDYNTGMDYFRSNLSEEKIRSYKDQFKESNLPVVTTFYYSPDVLNIKVKNNFTLHPIEERRIREKFSTTTSFANLFDFFMEYGDQAEGAGLGITLVGILLDQSGIDKHAFTLYSSSKYNETIAKLEIPLVDDYISKRSRFSMELSGSGMTAEQLRKEFHYTYKDFRKNNS